MSETAIRVDNLSKQYRIGQRRPYKTVRESIQNLFRKPSAGSDAGSTDQTFWALKDINFEVKQGEVVGIIGRNGAGKSTLLKVLSRITEPTSGQVETTGRVGSLLEVGTGFHPELTGRENVYLNGAILGMRRSEIATKFEQIVAFAEIDRFLDTPVKFYSSGMYTRLAFAVAAHLEPEILIVDEVLAVGDAQFQQKCMGRMGEVAREGRTVLFVSHNLAAIREICETAIWLERGSVRATGAARDITSQYLERRSGGPNPHTVQSEECILVDAETLDADGRPAETLNARENWSIEVTFTLLREMTTGPAIRISTADGVVVFENHELIRGGPLRKPGTYRTRFDCSSAPLAPGTYLLSAYLMVHHVAVHLVADQFRRFSVIGSLVGYGGGVAPFDTLGMLDVRGEIATTRLSDG